MVIFATLSYMWTLLEAVNRARTILNTHEKLNSTQYFNVQETKDKQEFCQVQEEITLVYVNIVTRRKYQVKRLCVNCNRPSKQFSS